MIRPARRNSPGRKGVSHSARQVARETLDGAQVQLSKGFQGPTNSLAKRIRDRPVHGVLVALGVGLLLGRFKVRPVETVLLTSAAGFLVGMTLANGRRYAEH